MKRCTLCQQLKNESEFHVDNRRNDKLQAFCKVCKGNRNKEKREGKVLPREVVRKNKIMKLARAVADGKNLGEAYQSLGTTKSLKMAQKASTQFFSTIKEGEMTLFQKMLTPPQLLTGVSSFFEDVLTRKSESTIDEFVKVLHCWGKFAGTFAPEKVETKTATQTVTVVKEPEEKRDIIAEVAKMLKQQDEKEDGLTVEQEE